MYKLNPETGRLGFHFPSASKFLVTKVLTSGVPVLADNALNMTGNANKAMKGVGNAGEAITQVSKNFKNKSDEALANLNTGVAAGSQAMTNLGKAIDEGIKGDKDHLSLAESLKTVPGGIKDISEAAGGFNRGAQGLGNAGAAITPDTARQVVTGLTEIPQKIDAFGNKIDDTNSLLRGAMNSFGDTATRAGQFLSSPKGLMTMGGIAAAGGGYSILRDWLNHRQARKDRESEIDAIRRERKVAAPGPAVSAGEYFLKKVLPATVVGGGEAYMNYDPDHPWTAMLGGAIGAGSGSQLWRGRSALKFNPKGIFGVGAGAILPRTLALVSEETKKIHNENQASGGVPWKSLGGAAAVGGGLYLLNKLINKPAPDPTTNVQVDAPVTVQGGGGGFGGSGEPAAPGLGTLKIVLPKQHDRAHETSVQMPLENLALPQTYYDRIKRDTKRQLRTELNDRTRHRKPLTLEAA